MKYDFETLEKAIKNKDYNKVVEIINLSCEEISFDSIDSGCKNLIVWFLDKFGYEGFDDLKKAPDSFKNEIIENQKLFACAFAYELFENGLISPQEYVDFLNEQIKNNNFSASRYKGRLYFQGLTSSFDDSIADCTKAIELNPFDIFSYGTRGFLYCEKKDFAAAISDFEKVLELNPKDDKIKDMLTRARLEISLEK